MKAILPFSLWITASLAQGPALVEPPVRSSQNLLLTTVLEAAVAPVNIGGRRVLTGVYEGMFPGPTLRVRPGDRILVTVINRLPRDYSHTPGVAHDHGEHGVTNLHTHGLHVSPRLNSDNPFILIKPFQMYQFDYTVPFDHEAGLYWYHPHMHGDVYEQMYRGMLGALIVEGELDRLPGIAGVPERLLILKEVQFGEDGNIAPAAARTPAGSMFTVNGQPTPVIKARPGETQRWRILNACATATMRISLDGHMMYQIAADGHTFKESAPTQEITLAPGARAEVLIQAANAGTYTFRTLAYSTGPFGTPNSPLATLSVEGEVMAKQNIPTLLLPSRDLREDAVAGKREIVFNTETVDGQRIFTIDGKVFDEDRVDQVVQLDTTEEWTIKNISTGDHPFHLHVYPFQVTAVNGNPVPFQGYNDTVNVPPNGSLTILIRFADFVGKSVYHCHLPSHEDLGMMAIIRVDER